MSFAAAFRRERCKLAAGPAVFQLSDAPALASRLSDGALGTHIPPHRRFGGPASVYGTQLLTPEARQALPDSTYMQAGSAGSIFLPPKSHPDYKLVRRHELTHYLQHKNKHWSTRPWLHRISRFPVEFGAHLHENRPANPKDRTPSERLFRGLGAWMRAGTRSDTGLWARR